jgi:hypothetical protein
MLFSLRIVAPELSIAERRGASEFAQVESGSDLSRMRKGDRFIFLNPEKIDLSPLFFPEKIDLSPFFFFASLRMTKGRGSAD